LDKLEQLAEEMGATPVVIEATPEGIECFSARTRRRLPFCKRSMETGKEDY
jgi:hypothetical protein